MGIMKFLDVVDVVDIVQGVLYKVQSISGILTS